jgi:hypothetical protein
VRIVLHLGQGKTGTKALQHALAAARGHLAEHGVLYPEMGEGAVAHHLLLPLCGGSVPAHVSARWGFGDDAVRAAARAYSALGREVARSRPGLLVLSSETLLFGAGAAEKARLAALLRPMSDEIRPVVYVREPAGLYLARLLEKMRVAAAPRRRCRPRRSASGARWRTSRRPSARRPRCWPSIPRCLGAATW